MKHLKVAGLCLVSMLMVSMALAGTASAQPLWLACLSGTANQAPTKYTTNQCSTANQTTGTFQWNEVSGTDKVTILAMSLRLTDEKATGGKSTIKCNHISLGGEGIVGPGNKGKITVAKAPKPKTECERVEGGCKAGEVEKVEGVHLPWQTELYETEGQAQTRIEADGNGEPGWEVECNSLLGLEKDLCETEGPANDEVVTLLNVNTSGVLLVLGKFLVLRRAKCSQGGAKAGLVLGQLAILLASGAGLRIDPV